MRPRAPLAALEGALSPASSSPSRWLVLASVGTFGVCVLALTVGAEVSDWYALPHQSAALQPQQEEEK